MRTRLPFLLITLLAACVPEDPNAPTAGVSAPAALPQASAVYPPGSYKITLLPAEGVFEDVSDTRLIVGTIAGQAVAMPLGGSVFNLKQGTASASSAHGVNNPQQIVGSLNLGTQAAPQLVPAFWKAPTTLPVALRYAGEALDLNDAGIAVGTIQRGTAASGFAWDLMGVTPQSLHLLQPLPGGRNTRAYAISPDWIIVGESDAPLGWTSVIWKWDGSTWKVNAVQGGIVGFDIDGGVGIVGRTAGRASFGSPDHLGYFATLGPSTAWAVNARGVATGDDVGSSPGWPQNTAAFVADRSGAMTVLPLPANPNGFGWRASYGNGINTCGLVVGTLWAFPGHPYTAQPAVWDPGC